MAAACADLQQQQQHSAAVLEQQHHRGQELAASNAQHCSQATPSGMLQHVLTGPQIDSLEREVAQLRAALRACEDRAGSLAAENAMLVDCIRRVDGLAAALQAPLIDAAPAALPKPARSTPLGCARD